MSSKARVVNTRKEPCDEYVGRPTIWGNPFRIGRDGNRNEVVEKYRAWLLTRPELVQQLPTLRGKILGCWCAPKRCHADILVELANK